MHRTVRALSATAALTLLLSACGTDEGSDPSTTESPNRSSPSPYPRPSEEPTASETDSSPEVPETGGADEPPSLGEVIELAWEAALEQESVTVQGQVTSVVPSPEPMEELAEEEPEETTEEDLPESDPEDAQAAEQEDELEAVEVGLSGAVDGEGTRYEHGVRGEYLIFDGGGLRLQTVESFVEDYDRAAQEQGIEAQIPGDELRAAFAPEVQWIEVGTPTTVDAETVEEFLDELRERLLEDLEDQEISLETEPSVETVDEEQLWVYQEEGLSLSVSADSEEPLLQELELELTALEFSHWNATEPAQRPEDHSIVYREELNEVLLPLVEP